MQRRKILDARKIQIIIHRLALELAEQHEGFLNTGIIGLQPRGIIFAQRLHNKLKDITGNGEIPFGMLDSTFYRDDFRRGTTLVPSSINLNFLVEDKKVVLIDDVLYTGRSVRSALNALADFGRPLKTELLVLIDRVHNRELPIEPNYAGERIDTRSMDHVEVFWQENGSIDEVWITTEN
jgi:pyrimidine operon attenuation protein / uracil phosphoribosyltransferase